jgi:hypothetical protein
MLTLYDRQKQVTVVCIPLQEHAVTDTVYLHSTVQCFPTMVSRDIFRGGAGSRRINECSYVSCNVIRRLYPSIKTNSSGQAQWPRGLRRGSAAARLLGLRFRITLGAWVSAPYECCVLSGCGLCHMPIKTNSHIPYRSHAALMPFPCYAVPLRV